MAKIIVQEKEIAILTIWKQLNNSNFKPVEFEGFSKAKELRSLIKLLLVK